MVVLASRAPLLGGVFRRLVWLIGGLGSLAAGAVAAVLAVVLTATLAMVAVIGMALVGFTAAALRHRRAARSSDPNVIEARHIGGHSWVAYGWDQDGRQA